VTFDWLDEPLLELENQTLPIWVSMVYSRYLPAPSTLLLAEKWPHEAIYAGIGRKMPQIMYSEQNSSLSELDMHGATVKTKSDYLLTIRSSCSFDQRAASRSTIFI
jgi:hypothetical protein